MRPRQHGQRLLLRWGGRSVKPQAHLGGISSWRPLVSRSLSRRCLPGCSGRGGGGAEGRRACGARRRRRACPGAGARRLGALPAPLGGAGRRASCTRIGHGRSPQCAAQCALNAHPLRKFLPALALAKILCFTCRAARRCPLPALTSAIACPSSVRVCWHALYVPFTLIHLQSERVAVQGSLFSQGWQRAAMTWLGPPPSSWPAMLAAMRNIVRSPSESREAVCSMTPEFFPARLAWQS